MATGTIEFAVGSERFPDGSASNLAPQPLSTKSSGAAPGAYVPKLAFDATNVEWCQYFVPYWPADYGSALTAKVQYSMASATTGGVAWDVRLAAITSGDATDVDADVYSSANVGTDTVAGTAGYVKTVSFTVTNADSVAAGDKVAIYLGRATGDAGDTATGDAEMLGLALTYTTA